MKKALGEELVEACLDVDAERDTNNLTGVKILCSVYGGRIRAKSLSVAETVRFVCTMRAAGYDLIKMAAGES